MTIARKPKSANDILRKLLKNKKFTLVEQLEVIETLKNTLLNNFCGSPLGDLACMNSGDGFLHTLDIDKPITNGTQFELDRTGLYYEKVSVNNEKLCTFGADAKSWFSIEISYIIEEKEKPNSVFSKYKKATRVHVFRKNLLTIMEEQGVSMFMVINFLEFYFNDWISSYEQEHQLTLRKLERTKREFEIIKMAS